MIALALALILQFPIDPPVTLVLRDREIILKKSEAEAWYKVIDPVREQALHVALNHALGIAPVEPCRITWEQHVAEVQSWWAAPKREPACNLR